MSELPHGRRPDLETGDIIRRGDVVRVHWNLDENGLLNCALEVPSIGRRFDTGKMFTDHGGHKSFEGREGEELANSVLDTTATELEELKRAVGTKNDAEAAELARRGRDRHHGHGSTRQERLLEDIAMQRHTVVRELRSRSWPQSSPCRWPTPPSPKP